MSHVHEGPIASYNSLHDGNLSSYFGNARVRKHLVKAGLISKDGRLVSEDQYRIMLARREHKRMIKDMISQAIVQRTLEVERQRQAEIKKKLEEIAKLELVKRVRASRGRRGDEEVLQYLLPLPSRDDSKRLTRASAKGQRMLAECEEDEEVLTPIDQGQEDSSVRDRNFDCFAHLHRKNGKSPYPKEKIEMYNWTNLDRTAIEEYHDMTRDVDTLPALAPYNNADYRAHRQRSVSPKRRPVLSKTIPFSRASSLHRPGSLIVLHEAKVKSLCEVTIKFLGLGLTSGPASAFHDISIDQQHCGGNTLTVFKGRLSEGDVFTFVSRRHLDFPFSLTIYVDSKVDCRLSSCCEYKHRLGHKLGGTHGHFRLQEVRGAAACYKCQAEGANRRSDSDASSSSSSEEGSKQQRLIKQERTVSASQKYATKQKRKTSKSSKKVSVRSDESEHISASQTSSSRQQAVVRLADNETKVLESHPVAKGVSGTESETVQVTKTKTIKATTTTTIVNTSYDEEKFEDDQSEDEPDSHSAAITTPLNEPTNVPSVSIQRHYHPQPPQVPKPQTRSHPTTGQSATTKHFDNTSLLATLAQASAEEVTYGEGVKSETATTAIVKLPSRLGLEEPSSPVQVKQLSFQQATSFHKQVALSSNTNAANEEVNITASGNSSVHSTPLLSPTAVFSPIMSPTQSKSQTIGETKQSADRPISPQQQQPPSSRTSSILKKSVSFNEVRLERQISDEEQYSPDESDRGSPIAHPDQAKSEWHPPAANEPDEEDEDPDAVVNHEAALALEDQQKATEDKTPFLQPESTVLDINKRTLNDRQVRRLCAEILNTDRLEKIVIRESGLNDGMVQRICDALQHSSNPIRLVCLNLNAISAAGIVHVVQLLHSKPSIKMLLLYGNPLGDNGLNALVDGIFGELPEDLKNSLSAQGIELPAESEDAPVRLQLTHLDLGEIGISSAGAIKFSKLLERLPTLRVLNLGGNHNVGLEGWSAISKSLSDKAYPAKLCLSHCRLGNKCTAELATALRTNTGVENVDLEGCGIGEEGGRALLEFVESEPRKLENIILTDNRIPERLVNRIDEVLKKLRGEDEEEDN